MSSLKWEEPFWSSIISTYSNSCCTVKAKGRVAHALSFSGSYHIALNWNLSQKKKKEEVNADNDGN